MKVHIIGRGNAAGKHREAHKRVGNEIVVAYRADVIDICTKPCDHFYYAMDAIEAGKTALIEKPPCATVAELDELIAGNAAVYVMNQYRHLPLDKNRLRHQVWVRGDSYYAGWRDDPKQALGGVLMSHGIHFIDWYIHNVGNVWEAKVHDVKMRDSGIESYIDISLDGFFMAFEITPIVGRDFHIPNPGYERALSGETPPSHLRDFRHTMEVIEDIYAQIR